MTKRQQWRRGRSGDLPDWYGPDKPFVRRTIFELLREDEERDARQLDIRDIRDINSSKRREPDKLQSALTQAWFGEIAPLRALYPEISEYINLPKRKRGVTLPKNRRRKSPLDPVMMAADTAREIYAIWRRDYGRKKRYSSRGQSTAAAVAVEYWKLMRQKVDVGAVERALHHGRGRKPPP